MGRLNDRRPIVGRCICLTVTFLVGLGSNMAAGDVRIARSESSATSPGTRDQYCESESFHATCPTHHVIAMHSAMYGRMRIGRCVEADLGGHLGCGTSVLDLTDQRCSGRSDCNIRIPDGEFDTRKPCFKELKVYLEANYTCLRVAGEDHSCTVTAAVNSVSHLSSLIDNRNRCGSKLHPWVIRADPGQKINISLVDFSPNKSLDGTTASSGGCSAQLGYIVEGANKKNVSLCGLTSSADRQSFVYRSESNTVEIVLLPVGPKTRHNFLVRYEAAGCSDLRLLQDAWIKRTDDEAIIGCQSTRQTWHLQCRGHQWVGVIGNCTQHMLSALKEARIGLPTSSITHDMLIVIVMAVSVLLCILIVATGLACLRSLTRSTNQRNIHYDNVKVIDDGGFFVSGANGGGANDTRIAQLQAPLPPNAGYAQVLSVPLQDPEYTDVQCSAYTTSSTYTSCAVASSSSNPDSKFEMENSRFNIPLEPGKGIGYFVLDRDLKTNEKDF